MNKTRILGILLLISGISLFLLYDNDGIDFAFGFLSALGLILTIAGRFKNKD
ncbi:hypothetical protein SAMN06265371_106212 [Lutibacter agarilyticus]|uniref:Uncharacterized protein n=1 Tax=Lutibacter agarilyticus TaxID=1109740 RepID=A0A238XRQ9_9FLAO|nr:hypothetical protein [Lutibacter agarilyticus]SNR60699.1 hypothetical protein SAMN06265371_106212 [Lutibacter agarilyticus]